MRWPPHKWEILLSLLLLAVFGYFAHFWPRFRTANEGIRLYFVEAVVDERSPYVDEVIARRGSNCDAALHLGKHTLDKAPGISYGLVPFYWLLTRAGMSRDEPQIHHLYRVLGFLGASVPAVVGFWWLVGLLRRLLADERASLSAALIVTLATPYSLYGTLLFGHVAAAAFTCGSLYHVLGRRPLTAGALAGAMVLVDTSTFAIAAGLGVSAAAIFRRPQDLALFVAGSVPFLLAQLAHNAWLFGDPLAFGYANKVAPELAAIHAQGVFGFTWPTTDRLWGILFSSQRGLLFHAPVLALAPLGFLLLARRKLEIAFSRRTVVCLAVICFAHTLLIGAFVDWRAGDTYAARHLLPMVPLLGVGLGALIADRTEQLGRAGLLLRRTVLPATALVSAVSCWAPAATFPYAPEALTSPLTQLAFPMLWSGHLSPSVASAIGAPPGVVLALFSLLVAVTVVVALARQIRLRVMLRGAVAALVGSAVLLMLIVAGRPHESYGGRAGRALAECLFGHQQTARALCESVGGLFNARHCRCVFPRSWREAPVGHPPLAGNGRGPRTKSPSGIHVDSSLHPIR